MDEEKAQTLKNKIVLKENYGLDGANATRTPHAAQARTIIKKMVVD